MLMVRSALPTLLARWGGSIINTSSGATLLGDLFLPAYAASKSAVNTLTKYVAAQYGKDNIRCNAISPGLIITQGAEHVADRFDVYKRHTLLPELGTPGDIAAMAIGRAACRESVCRSEENLGGDVASKKKK